MPFKTVQILGPQFPLDTTPGLDRFAHTDPITNPFLEDLIARDELPRFRGSEVEFETNPEYIKITMYWKSQAVAQEYADFCTQNTGKEHFKSVEVIEY